MAVTQLPQGKSELTARMTHTLGPVREGRTLDFPLRDVIRDDPRAVYARADPRPAHEGRAA